MDQSKTIKDCSRSINSVASVSAHRIDHSMTRQIEENSVADKKQKYPAQEKRQRLVGNVVKEQKAQIKRRVDDIVSLTAEIRTLKSEKIELKKERDSLKSKIEKLEKVIQHHEVAIEYSNSDLFMTPWRSPVPDASSAIVSSSVGSDSGVRQPTTTIEMKVKLETQGYCQGSC